MKDTRKRNANWVIKSNSDGTSPTDNAQLAVLMDIRDELQRLNRLLSCTDFLRIPWELGEIRKHTAAKRRKKVRTVRGGAA